MLEILAANPSNVIILPFQTIMLVLALLSQQRARLSFKQLSTIVFTLGVIQARNCLWKEIEKRRSPCSVAPIVPSIPSLSALPTRFMFIAL